MPTDKNRIDGENKNLSRKGNASFRYIRNKRELIFRTGTTIFQFKRIFTSSLGPHNKSYGLSINYFLILIPCVCTRITIQIRQLVSYIIKKLWSKSKIRRDILIKIIILKNFTRSDLKEKRCSHFDVIK